MRDGDPETLAALHVAVQRRDLALAERDHQADVLARVALVLARFDRGEIRHVSYMLGRTALTFPDASDLALRAMQFVAAVAEIGAVLSGRGPGDPGIQGE